MALSPENRPRALAGPPPDHEGLAARADVPALARRWRALLDRRSPWDSAWQSLAEHFLPTRCRLGPEDENRPLLNKRLVDATGILAMRTLAAGLHGGMTSPARQWFRLSLDDADLADSRAGQLYLDEVERRMRVVFQRSNFYNAMHTLYAELGTFGTAFVFELADPRHGFRFLPLCAGEYALDTDAARRVDTVFRRSSMSLRQIEEAFGPHVLPDSLRQAARRTPDQRQTVIHAVFPRRGRRPGLLTAAAMPVASVYWLEGREGNATPLRVSGFCDFPGFGPRWDVAGNEVYGRSPAMDALPDCRMLQQMGITTLKAIHKAVDPPMSVSAGLRSVGLDLTPGGINYVDSLPGQNPQAATPLLQLKPELAQSRQAMQAVQEQIRAGLYNDLFRLILEGRSKVTASEIAAREEEKMVLIGPVLERLHDELFIPLIDRTFSLMQRLDMLPPCPPELVGRRLKVEFVSLLAQAQKLVGSGATDQYLSLTLRAAAAWPEALDSLDVDNMLDTYARNLGLPVSITRSRQEREQLRQARAEAQQQQSLLKQLEQAAELGKTLSQSEITLSGEKRNLLDGIALGLQALLPSALPGTPSVAPAPTPDRPSGPAAETGPAPGTTANAAPAPAAETAGGRA
ncbi:portal protein [uncultured Desulfovibrio sp.]|uniref:portal protein n=1 Tax=uncultured Desulfovibrio sp. TaxID=167968 RepID=UPI00262CD3F5|nr:portal protein [uncultured Desulfovibrio sp.]